MEAARNHITASKIVSDAVHEWLERRDDTALLPVIKAARDEWKEKGGRPWSEVEREMEEAIDSREQDAAANGLQD